MKAIGIIANTAKPKAADTIKRLKRLFAAAGVEPRLDHESARLIGRTRGASTAQLAAETQMLVVLGGDGTILRVASEMGGASTPILGVNLGGLGFLTAIPLEKLEVAVAELLKGRYTLSARTTLQARVRRAGKAGRTYYALNDFLLSRGAPARVVRVQVELDGKLLTEYHSDGVAFATPTGSTAYSMSAGGPVLTPETRAFVITPICPHPFNDRPLVVPHSAVVAARLMSVSAKPLLFVDGHKKTALKKGDLLEVSGSGRIVQLVTLQSRTYYDVLREKLKWSVLNIGLSE